MLTLQSTFLRAAIYRTSKEAFPDQSNLKGFSSMYQSSSLIWNSFIAFVSRTMLFTHYEYCINEAVDWRTWHAWCYSSSGALQARRTWLAHGHSEQHPSQEDWSSAPYRCATLPPTVFVLTWYYAMKETVLEIPVEHLSQKSSLYSIYLPS